MELKCFVFFFPCQNQGKLYVEKGRSALWFETYVKIHQVKKCKDESEENNMKH